MTKDELLDALEEERENFMETIAGLSDEELEQPGAAGDWSVKDVITHLSMWEAEMIKLLWQARQGQKPTTIHFTPFKRDEVNQQWVQETRERPLERVFDDFESVRRQTIRRVEAFTEKDLNDPQRYPWLKGRPLSEWISADSFRHDAEHAAQIQAWRQSFEESPD